MIIVLYVMILRVIAVSYVAMVLLVSFGVYMCFLLVI